MSPERGNPLTGTLSPPNPHRTLTGTSPEPPLKQFVRLTLAKQIQGETLHGQYGRHQVVGRHWLDHKRHDRSPAGCPSRTHQVWHDHSNATFLVIEHDRCATVCTGAQFQWPIWVLIIEWLTVQAVKVINGQIAVIKNTTWVVSCPVHACRQNSGRCGCRLDRYPSGCEYGRTSSIL